MNQILTQEEVDVLLSGMRSGDLNTENIDVNGLTGDSSGSFDFIKNTKKVKGSFPALDMVYEVFCRKSRTTVSNLFGKIIENISLSDSRVMKYKDFIGNIKLPASFHIVKMTPLRGLGLLVIDSKLAFSFIDFILGGRGDNSYTFDDRELTNIEQVLVKKLNLNITSDLEKSWSGIYPIKIEEVSTESNPQFVSICFPSDMVMVTSIDVDVHGTIYICIPSSMMEPLRGKLSRSQSGMKTDVDLIWRKTMVSQLVKTNVEVKVELGETKITGRELLALKEGDTILLKNGPSDEFNIYIEGRHKLHGFPGAVKGNKAVQLVKGVKKTRREI